MKYYFQDHIAGIVLRAIAGGIVHTVYGFFNGGVRYSNEFVQYPPVWAQLLRNFLLVAIVWTAGELLFMVIEYFIKKKRGKI